MNLMPVKVKLVNTLLKFRFFQKIFGKKWYERWSRSYTPVEAELRFLPKIITPGGVVLDIGANRGEVSYFLSKGCSCKTIYAFEPQEKMFGVLCGVAECVPEIKPFQVALSDTTGTKKLAVPLQNGIPYSQEASLEDKNGDTTVSESVTTDTLDNFLKENRIANVDFIKCDTEGHELSIFSGAKNCLQTMRPIVLLEIYPHKGAVHRNKVFDLFNAYNYEGFVCDKAGGLLMKTDKGTPYAGENHFFFPAEKSRHIVEKANQKN